MREAMDDGRLQITAASILLEKSLLVSWNSIDSKFDPVNEDVFECSWRSHAHPVFGRLLCWITFATGAEFLAKGVCLVRGVEIRSDHEVPCYPRGPIHEWVAQFQKDWKSCGTITTTKFGTLGSLTREAQDGGAPLTRLCAIVGATKSERELIFAAYELLRRTIRNRDAHAYVPKVRAGHHWVVPELFCECFNQLLGWVPGGPSILKEWRHEAAPFVEGL